jgi:glycosyltransferase involved in cell wall biosynthesis
MPNKNLLMICYYYPPLADVGCMRSVSFSNYWRKLGWKLHVLSVDNPDPSYCKVGNEPDPEGVDVYRTKSVFNVSQFFGRLNGLLCRIMKPFGLSPHRNYLYDIFCIPDIFMGWIPLTVIRALKIIKEKEIDAIYVSCSPFSSGFIGLILKMITKKPLFVDYRDQHGLDIGKYKNGLYYPRFRLSIDRKITEAILRQADVFTVTTEETKELYIEQYPFIAGRIHTIHNGFEGRYLEGLVSTKKNEKFTVIYSGEFYPYIEYEYFFEALAILKQSGTIHADNFQFLYFDGKPDMFREMFDKYPVRDLVHFHSRISHEEILREIRKSHLHLLRIFQPMISTKMYEGIALDIPFLATIPTGEVERIIRKYSPSSRVVTDQCSRNVAERIKEAMVMYQGCEITSNRVESFLSRFSRSCLAEKLYGIYRDYLSQTMMDPAATDSLVTLNALQKNDIWTFFKELEIF